MTPDIRSFPERTVVGMGERFISILSPDADNHTVIPQLWDTFINRIGEVRARANRDTLGVCMGLPESFERRHDAELFYLAGAEVDSTDEVPDGMTVRTIPAGEFAVFTHVGPIDRLGETIGGIYGEWLPASGYQRRDDLPDVELYDERFDGMSPTSELEIHVPVARR